jgi:hypothetical protein
MTMKPFEIQSTSLSLNGVVLDTSVSGKLLIPGITRATVSVAIEVNDIQDQTKTWNNTPVIIDGYTYAVSVANEFSGQIGWTAATYAADGIDGEGFIDGISVVDGGAGYTGEAVTYSQTMWAADSGTPIDGSSLSSWYEIPFRVRCGAGDIESEFSSGGATHLYELSDVAIDGPSAGQVLTWNGQSEQWENQNLPGSGGSGTINEIIRVTDMFPITAVDTGTNSVSVDGDVTEQINNANAVNINVVPPWVTITITSVSYDSGTGKTMIVIDPSSFTVNNGLVDDNRKILLQSNSTSPTSLYLQGFDTFDYDGTVGISANTGNITFNGTTISSDTSYPTLENHYNSGGGVEIDYNSDSVSHAMWLNGEDGLAIQINRNTTALNWYFGPDGNLTFPDGSKQNTASTGGGGADTGNISFVVTSLQSRTDTNVGWPNGVISLMPGAESDSGYVNRGQYLNIYPTNAEDAPHIHIAAGMNTDTGNLGDLILGNDNQHIDINGAGNIVIKTNNQAYAWTFSPDGALYMPPGDGSNIDSGQIFSNNESSFINMDVQFNTDITGGMRLGTDAEKPLDIMTYAGNEGGVRNWRFSGDGSGTLTMPNTDWLDTGNVTVKTTQDFSIGVGDPQKVWNFDQEGNITVPGDIKTVSGGYSFTSAIANVAFDGSTVYVNLVDNVFGGPTSGRVRITGVSGTAEANGTWYYEATDPNQLKLKTDSATDANGSGWGSYNAGGHAVSVIANDLNVYTGDNQWKFGADGDLVLPEGKTIRDKNGTDLLAGNSGSSLEAPYKGFRAHYGSMYDNNSDPNGPINKIVIYKDTVTPSSTINSDTDIDQFTVTGLTGSDIVAMLVVISDNITQTSTTALKEFAEAIVDNVILTNGNEGSFNNVDEMKTAFYNNFNNFNSIIPSVKTGFQFFYSNFNVSGSSGGSGSGLNIWGLQKRGNSLDLGSWANGTGYQVNDVITILGTNITDQETSSPLASPDNDITVTITGVDGSGAITSYTVSGTLPDIWPTNYINDGGDDEYDTGNYINTDLGNELSYNNGNAVYGDSNVGGGDYVATYQSGIFGFFTCGAAINSIGTDGGSGFDGSGMSVTGGLYGGDTPAASPVIATWTNPNSNIWRIETYSGGAAVSYNGGDGELWWDVNNSPSGSGQFRGAIIEYHAFIQGVGTIVGTIHIANDYDFHGATHTEHLSGDNGLNNLSLWVGLGYRGQLYFKDINGSSRNMMVQWTSKVFYGSENAC